MPDYRISFQLYSARKSQPVEAQLETLARLGYDAVEPFLELYQDDPAAFRALADSQNLPMPSVMSKIGYMDENAGEAIAAAKILGAGIIVLPYLSPEERPTDPARWQAVADRIRGHAERAAEAGLKLAWHNHEFEYVTLPDGSRPIDLILAGAHVGFQPDVAWLARAGCPIGAEIRRYADKIDVIHMKDVAPAGVEAEGGWADAGLGTIDWADVRASMRACPARLLVVEHDDPADWKKTAANSLAFLKKLSS